MSKYDFKTQEVVFVSIGWKVETMNMSRQNFDDLLKDITELLETVKSHLSTAYCFYNLLTNKDHTPVYTFDQLRDMMNYCCKNFDTD